MEMEPGQVVKSLAGRDKGKLYLVIGFAENKVLLADGRCRKISNPKKKNPKHLQPYRNVFPEVKKKIHQGNLDDNVIRYSLNILHPKEKAKRFGPLDFFSSDERR